MFAGLLKKWLVVLLTVLFIDGPLAYAFINGPSGAVCVKTRQNFRTLEVKETYTNINIRTANVRETLVMGKFTFWVYATNELKQVHNDASASLMNIVHMV